MKLKYIIASLAAAALCVATGCQKEQANVLGGISLDKSIVVFETAGGTKTITVDAAEAWKFQEQTWIEGKDTTKAAAPKWLTLDKTSGAAGKTTITFTTAETVDAHEATLLLACGNEVQNVLVKQFAGTVPVSTCADVLAGTDGKTYRVQGTCTKITNTSYGNWYINDGTSEDLYIYGTVDETGSYADWSTYDIELGDVVTVEGPRTTYGGVVELKDVSVIGVVKSLLKVFPEEGFTIDKDGDVAVIKAVVKGDNLLAYPQTDWISISSIETTADTTFISIKVEANEGDTREGNVELISNKGTQQSVLHVTVTQKSGLNAYTLPYSETFAKGIGAWEIVNSELPEGLSYVWSWDSYGCMKASGYVSSEKKTYDANSSLQSPLIDLTTATTATLSFEHVQRYGSNNDVDLTLWVSKDNGEVWQQVLIPEYSDGKSWNCITSTVSLTSFVGNQIKIMFDYNSVSTGCATWEIKNIQVTEGEADITSIAQLAGQKPAAKSAKATFKGTLTDATVTYINGNNVYLQDATGAILLYQSGHGLAVGDSFTGEVSGTITNYSALPELTAIDFSKATKTTGKTVTPAEITLDKLNSAFLRYMSYYIKINDVEFKTAITKSNRNGLITDGTNEIIAYASVKNTLEMSGKGSLVCFPTVYGSTGSMMGATPELSVWSNDHWTPAN